MINLEITQINVLIWILFGLIIGSVVHLFDPGDAKGGIFATLALGVIGSVLGGLTAAYLFQKAATGINFQDFIIAIVGGLILAIIYRFIFRDKHHIRTINMKL